MAKKYKLIEGNFETFTGQIDIIVSRFNSSITSNLLEGALDCLRRHNVAENSIRVIYVPGSFEIPLAAKKAAKNPKTSAVLALGCLIRGATFHYDLISSQVSRYLGQIALETEKPVIFGVLTTDTIEQALERSGSKQGNKGAESALSTLEMLSLLKKL
ncbi:6,7-dimethyl-8-ribityllumazine synthase [Candidatus Riflebacteria bacterium]